jgi:hypothetical protein
MYSFLTSFLLISLICLSLGKQCPINGYNFTGGIEHFYNAHKYIISLGQDSPTDTCTLHKYKVNEYINSTDLTFNMLDNHDHLRIVYDLNEEMIYFEWVDPWYIVANIVETYNFELSDSIYQISDCEDHESLSFLQWLKEDFEPLPILTFANYEMDIDQHLECLGEEDEDIWSPEEEEEGHHYLYF